MKTKINKSLVLIPLLFLTVGTTACVGNDKASSEQEEQVVTSHDLTESEFGPSIEYDPEEVDIAKIQIPSKMNYLIEEMDFNVGENGVFSMERLADESVEITMRDMNHRKNKISAMELAKGILLGVATSEHSDYILNIQFDDDLKNINIVVDDELYKKMPKASIDFDKSSVLEAISVLEILSGEIIPVINISYSNFANGELTEIETESFLQGAYRNLENFNK